MNSTKEFQPLLSPTLPPTTQFHSYLCLEQPQTIQVLTFLTAKPLQSPSTPSTPSTPLSHTIIFNSQQPQQNNPKRQRAFNFDGIFKHQQKNRYYFQREISEICRMALIGYNQNIFIYGTEQQPKDKLLIGQSQNPGLFLLVLSHLFEYCHENSLEDFITLKLSAPVYKNGKFIDIFSNQPVSLRKDQIQGIVLQTCPQIIIRNVKTGLKLLNLIYKSIKQMRQNQLTQNLILSLKIEIDWHSQKTDKQQQTTVYCLSKINFIKLANPSINSSLKGVNRNNVWFVNLFNLLRCPNNQGGGRERGEEIDDFTLFLRETVLSNSQKTYCLTSVTNKMSSNQCLTAFLFSNYLKSLNSPTITRTLINLPHLETTITHPSPPLTIFLQNNPQIIHKLLQKLLESQQIKNYLEYEYSLVIGEACQKLNKYIFTEDLEDFYYAKKIQVKGSADLQEAYKDMKRVNAEIGYLRKKIQRKCVVDDRNREEELGKIFDILVTMTHHFLLQQAHIQKIAKLANIQHHSNNPYMQELLEKMGKMSKKQSYGLAQTIKESNSTNQMSTAKKLQMETPKAHKYSNILNPIQQQDQQIYTASHQQPPNQSQQQPLNQQQQPLNQQPSKSPIKNYSKSSHTTNNSPPLYKKNRSPLKDNLTYMFTNKNMLYKHQANRF